MITRLEALSRLSDLTKGLHPVDKREATEAIEALVEEIQAKEKTINGLHAQLKMYEHCLAHVTKTINEIKETIGVL